jgi:hypothetical protein
VTPPHSFRVVIASRPEYDIRTAFGSPPLNSITKIVHLETYEVSGEIYGYLSDEFARIRQSHPAKGSIPSGWPGDATLRALTNKASGIWAYPSTVIKYIDNPRRHPVDLLDHVLKPQPIITSGRPFAELDALYEIILNPPDIDFPLMKRLLHLIIEITRLSASLPRYNALNGEVNRMVERILSAPQLDEFLFLREGTTEMTLCDLHSILSVPEGVEFPGIYFHHQSLEDYLCSSHRAGNLYQSQADTRSDIFNVCCQHIELWDQKMRRPNPGFQSGHFTLQYSCMAWKHLLVEEKIPPPSDLDYLARIIWRCFAFAGLSPCMRNFGLNDFVDHFHNAMVGWIDLF